MKYGLLLLFAFCGWFCVSSARALSPFQPDQDTIHFYPFVCAQNGTDATDQVQTNPVNLQNVGGVTYQQRSGVTFCNASSVSGTSYLYTTTNAPGSLGTIVFTVTLVDHAGIGGPPSFIDWTQNTGGSNSYHVLIYRDTSNHMCIYMGSIADPPGGYCSSSTYADNVEYNLAVTYDEGNNVIKLYNSTNGLLLTRPFDHIPNPHPTSFAMGGVNTDGNPGPSTLLTQMFIEDRPWTDQEVQNYFTNFIGNPASTPNGNGSTTCPPNCQGTASEPISTGTGNYLYQHTDFVIPGRGIPLGFQRSYNSLDNYSGPLGTNWGHNYNIILGQDPDGTVHTRWGDGHGETFTLSGTNYIPQAGIFSTLTKSGDGSFTLTQKNQSRYNFSSAGKLLTIQDRNGNTVTLIYDGSGNLIQVTDAVGRNLTFSYDGSNRITRVTDPIGRVVSFQYGANNNLAQATDPASGITTFSYDSNHRVTSITLPNGATLLQNAYDTSGRVISQTGGRGFATTLAYNTPNPGDTTITDARGNQALHSYDSSLRIVKITDAAGGTVTYTYDTSNDRTSVTNQNGQTTNFAYDAQGNVTSITDPLTNTASFTYDSMNDLLTATNAKGKTTNVTYDAKGNLTRIQDALGNGTSFAYDSFGELTSKTDARGNSTTFSYDSSGNLARITDTLSHATALSYDGIGRLTSITDPNGHTATADYDALSRLTSITDPLGHQTKFAYDAIGNLLKITDANAHATDYAYDAANNLVSVTDALSHVTHYAYDASNNRTRFTNAKGNATNYAYDVLNRLSTIADPLSFATAYTYDAVGNVVNITDAKTQTNQFTYDALNRLLGIAYADGRSVAYAYDANGSRTAMADSHGITTYSYDDLDRLIVVAHPGGKVVSYAYDAVGNRSRLTYPDGKVVNYVYDAANRLAQVSDWLSRNTAYSYDAGNNLTRTAYPNGASIAFKYDAANRLLQVANAYQGSMGNPISSFTYALDPVGNRVQVTDGSGKVTAYGYDRLNELTSVTADAKVTTFTYDVVGNRAKLTAPGTNILYTYDADDRLLHAGTRTFTYDADGNETSATQTLTGGLANYQYDAANRLIAATGFQNSAFAYDGDGNRVSQSAGTGAYNYVNDVAAALPVVLNEQGLDGNISYAYGLGLISASSSAFDFFYQYDGLGGVAGLTGPDDKLKARYVYDAWGQPTLISPDPKIGTRNKFEFTGEALDPGTQLYYLRARYYAPDQGRFISRDLFPGHPWFSTTLNRYIYGVNDPLLFTDHTGLTPAPTFENANSTVPYVTIKPAAMAVGEDKQEAQIEAKYQELVNNDPVLRDCPNAYCTAFRQLQLREEARMQVLGPSYKLSLETFFAEAALFGSFILNGLSGASGGPGGTFGPH